MINSLEDVFKAQIELNERTVPGLYNRIESENCRREWVLNMELAMRQEIAEFIDSFAWKWWKNGEDDINNAKVELVDILHFWVSLCTFVGMDAKEVFELYEKKNKLNHKRQEGGYKEGTYQKVVDGVEDNVREVTNG